MKNLLLILFSFLALNVSAQSKRQMVTLGGIPSNSAVSIMQVLDYPMLLAAAKDEKVESYELVITEGNDNGNAKTYSVTGSKISNDALDYLRKLNGKNGSILIKKIILAKESIKIKESEISYTF